MEVPYILGWRAFAIYITILIVTRILGKRELGQVSPFDFVVAIMLGELAVLTIENTDLPLWHGMVPIAIIVIAHFAVAYISMKSIMARGLLTGRPTILIQNGKIIERNLAGLRFNVNDLLGSLRERGIFDVSDVEFAIMENTGKLSVLPRSQKRPLMPSDLGVGTRYEGLSHPLIIDGKVQEKYLAAANLTRDWLMDQLAARGIKNETNVLLAILNSNGDLCISLKGYKAPTDCEPS